MNLHERALVDSFIKNNKKERYKSLLSKKGKEKFIANLYHMKDFDENLQLLIPPKEQIPIKIYNLLMKLGAKENCYVLSDNQVITEQEIPLKFALENVVGSGSVAIISCIPGKLVYYEGEDMGDRKIFRA